MKRTVLKENSSKRISSLLFVIVPLVLLSVLGGCSSRGGSTTTTDSSTTAKEPVETSELARHIDAGNDYLAAGDLRGATREYEAAQKIAPDDPFVLNNLGLVYMEKEFYSLAADNFRLALDILPYYYKAWNNLGNAYYELNYEDNAVEAYEEALRIKPNYALAHWNLALLLEQTGDSLEAIRHWQRYISLSAGEGDTAFARDRISALRGDDDSATGGSYLSDEEAGYGY